MYCWMAAVCTQNTWMQGAASLSEPSMEARAAFTSHSDVKLRMGMVTSNSEMETNRGHSSTMPPFTRRSAYIAFFLVLASSMRELVESNSAWLKKDSSGHSELSSVTICLHSASHSSGSTTHSFTSWLNMPPLIRAAPIPCEGSSAHDTEYTGMPPWATTSTRRSPVSVFQMPMVPSSLQDASTSPDGEKAMLVTSPECPDSRIEPALEVCREKSKGLKPAASTSLSSLQTCTAFLAATAKVF
mmetsp:Transcript_25608/g.48484  ORF Transcript_25608/g.48484 Transcript_25608/m.48484 type:complete len:243 (+) Transcript_25608:2198-2926(+)